jgi:peptidyl-prolyl cis-trans isomerase A (cyclophilin A)
MFRSTRRIAFMFSVCLLSLSMSAQQGAPSAPNGASGSSAAPGQQPPAASSPAPEVQNGAAQNQALPEDPGTTAHIEAPLAPEGPTAVFDTSMGRMICGLYSKEAPATTANFVGLATGSKESTTARSFIA